MIYFIWTSEVLFKSLYLLFNCYFIIFIAIYEESALEVFNVLSLHDVNTLQWLTTCTISEDSSFRETITNFDKSRSDWHLGSGNITHLNGILQSIAPSIIDKIFAAFTSTVKEVDWHVGNRKLGIRSARVISFISKNSMATKEELKEALKNREQNGNRLSLKLSDDNGTAAEPAEEVIKCNCVQSQNKIFIAPISTNYLL